MVYHPKKLDPSVDVVGSPKPTRLRQPTAVKRSVHAPPASASSPTTTKRTSSRMTPPNNNTTRTRRPMEKKNTRQQPALSKSIPTMPKANAPNRQRPPHSPHARSPPAPSKRGGHKPPNHTTRLPASRSPATTQKSLSPVAQMREQYDKLKLQVTQHDAVFHCLCMTNTTYYFM